MDVLLLFSISKALLGLLFVAKVDRAFRRLVGALDALGLVFTIGSREIGLCLHAWWP